MADYIAELGLEPIRLYKPRGRFYVTSDGDGPHVVDARTGALVGFETWAQAREWATFFRAYVTKWGDVSLYSVPSDIEDAPDLDRIQHLNQHMGDEPE